MRSATFYLVAFAVLPSLGRAQLPVFTISREESSIKFHVKASVDLTGTFDKWDASIKFSSREVETGVLDVKIQADSVNTGSGMKDGKLKSKDFFNVKEDPFITFHSTKIEQTGPVIFNFTGNFTIRGGL
jgi:polyisoprenoid-binding protein YceI